MNSRVQGCDLSEQELAEDFQEFQSGVDSFCCCIKLVYGSESNTFHWENSPLQSVEFRTLSTISK